MNQAAVDRKRKLQEIRDKSTKKASGVKDSEQNSEEQPEKTIKFRNYQPRDVALVKAFVSKDSNEENTSENSNQQQQTEAVIGDCDIIKNELRQYAEEEELNILPKNNNWDLKKQLEPKFDKLRRRTQRAIVDLLREKLAEEGDSDSDSDSEDEDDEA